MNSVASIKDRLKNKSRETGRTLQELFTLYGLERTIYRLSISRYRENFVLKGGIFLYALYRGNYPRSTTDIDLLAQRISNAEADMRAVFSDILSQEADDPLRFDLETLNVTPITEFKEYHGVNVSVTAYLDRTKILLLFHQCCTGIPGFSHLGPGCVISVLELIEHQRMELLRIHLALFGKD